MSAIYTVYGAIGSGSVPIEAALSLIGLPYRVEDHAPWEGAARASDLTRINPLLQVPALALPSGEIMTESAAILIWLADAFPQARLAPAVTDLARPAFLRWMNFVSSAIYALYWISDNPARVVDRAEDHESAKAHIYDRIAHCWGVMGAQVKPGRYLLGDDLSVLDLYVATASRWSPGRRRFDEVAPGLAEAVRRTDSDPRLATFWAERFPFVDGWQS
ncbi:glutathione S-transferase family protein [Dongia rigui]|uniref:Glutathione S-transferase family protein n=1 Tax=Dongia rigui TaxID=940149 RepID=A0ABU5E2T5_9PROT|nr:glutathione S-transferase family protein [Dongia rigui]MDY0873121.1 glutathione S-transferase family protein [Dongia rigui]